jgi:hypothetical protein
MGLSFLAIVASSLVVVHDFDISRAFRRPDKAHPELVVDPDRVLPLAITRQRVKTVAGRRHQVAEISSGVEVPQFPARHPDQISRKALRSFAIEDSFCGLVTEAPDHKSYVSFNDTGVKKPRINQRYGPDFDPVLVYLARCPQAGLPPPRSLRRSKSFVGLSRFGAALAPTISRKIAEWRAGQNKTANTYVIEISL